MSEDAPKDEIIHDAVRAIDRLGGNRTPAEEYAKLTQEFRDLLAELEIVIDDDIPLDPATGLRVALNQVDKMTELPVDAPLTDRVAHSFDFIHIPKPGDERYSEQMGIATELAINMIRNFGYLVAAIRDRDRFIANNASEQWEDGNSTDLLFTAVSKAGELLPWIAQGESSEEQVRAIQDQMYTHLTGMVITQSPKKTKKIETAKKTIDFILGSGASHKDRYGWD